MTESKQKAVELVEKFNFASIYFTNGFEGARLNAKTCAIISQEREVYLLKQISLISYLPSELLDEAQYILTHLKKML